MFSCSWKTTKHIQYQKPGCVMSWIVDPVVNKVQHFRYNKVVSTYQGPPLCDELDCLSLYILKTIGFWIIAL